MGVEVRRAVLVTSVCAWPEKATGEGWYGAVSSGHCSMTTLLTAPALAYSLGCAIDRQYCLYHCNGHQSGFLTVSVPRHLPPPPCLRTHAYCPHQEGLGTANLLPKLQFRAVSVFQRGVTMNRRPQQQRRGRVTRRAHKLCSTALAPAPQASPPGRLGIYN